MANSHAIANTHNFNKHLQSALLRFKLKFDINIHKKNKCCFLLENLTRRKLDVLYENKQCKRDLF